MAAGDGGLFERHQQPVPYKFAHVVSERYKNMQTNGHAIKSNHVTTEEYDHV